MDENNPYAPVAIQPKDRVVKETYLKDPIQRGAHPQPRVAPKVAVKRQPKKVRSPWEPTQLRFKKVAVRGHLARPRVEFERDIIAIDRVDEPTRQDFFQRVFEPARDEQF